MCEKKKTAALWIVVRVLPIPTNCYISMQPFGCLSPGRYSVVDIETSEGFDCKEVFGSGQFQKQLIVFSVIALWVSHSHTLAFPLISSEVDHWCKKPTEVNLSAYDWKRIAIPIESNGLHSRCTVYANPGDQNDTNVVDCNAWDYDPKRGSRSIVSEWNLVCKRSKLKTLATVIFLAGSLGSLVASAYCAHRFGRKPVIFFCVSVALVATLGSCFARTYPLYVITRFLISGCIISLSALSFTILAECCSFSARPTSLSFSITMGFILAETAFAVLKQVPPLNWVILQLIMVAPTFLLPIGFCVVPESPRWLIAARQLEAAERVMLSAAKLNGSQHDCVALLLQRVEQRLKAEELASTSSTVATDMTRVMRRRAVIMFGSTFSVMIAYYSLLLSLDEWRTAVPWTEWAPVVANALACCLLLKLVNRLEKTRLITSAFVILGSFCCFESIAALNATAKSFMNIVGGILLVLSMATSSFALVFNFVYVAELFPTPFRAISIGLLLAGGRLGSVVGALFSALEVIGREDLLFALIATAVYSSAYSFQYLPMEYGTYARLADAEANSTCPFDKSKGTLNTIDGMKQSLTSVTKKKKKQVTGKRRRRSSRKSSQSMTPATITVTPIPEGYPPSLVGTCK